MRFMHFNIRVFPGMGGGGRTIFHLAKYSPDNTPPLSLSPTLQPECSKPLLLQERHSECVETLLPVVYHTTHSTEIKALFVDACIKVGNWYAIIDCIAEWLLQPPFAEV